jgi:6-phosphofructokinase 1
LEKLVEFRHSGKRSGIVVLAEGAGHADELIAKLKGKVDLTIRGSVLGHIQRGGSPSNQDRYLGTCFGARAVQLLKEGKGNRVVGIKDNQIYDMDIVEALALPRKFNKELYNLASVVSR